MKSPALLIVFIRYLWLLGLASVSSVLASTNVLLRVTDENENPIPDCILYWQSPSSAGWQLPRVTYRVGPNGVGGDGSSLGRVRDTTPEAAEANPALGEALMNYYIIFNVSKPGPVAVKVTVEGYEPVVQQVGQGDPYGNQYFFQTVHMRRSRHQEEQPAPPPPQSAQENSYSVTLHFLRDNHRPAPNVQFTLVMLNSGRSFRGSSNSEGEADLTLPEYGPCKVSYFKPNGQKAELNEVIPMNSRKDITIFW